MLLLNAEEKQQQEEKAKSPKSCGSEDEPAMKESSNNESLVAEIKQKMYDCDPSELATFTSSLSGSPTDLMSALFDALYHGIEKGLALEVAQKVDHLAHAVQEVGTEMLLLRALELFCDGSGDAVKEVSLAVKALYEGNVVQDEIIFQWYKDGILGPNKNSRVWKNMKPFMECFATHYWCNQELSDLLNEPQE